MRNIDELIVNAAIYYAAENGENPAGISDINGSPYDGEDIEELSAANIDMVMDDLAKSGFEDVGFDYEKSSGNELIVRGLWRNGDTNHAAGWEISITPGFSGGYMISESYRNADENLRDEIGERICAFLERGEKEKPRLYSEIYETLLASRNANDMVWQGRHVKAVDNMLRQMEKGSGLKELDVDLISKNELLFSGKIKGEPFMACVFPDFRKGVRIETEDAKAEAALLKKLCEIPRNAEKHGPKG